MDIGFIGLGMMGQPMAGRLIDAGHSLVVYDSRPDAIAALVKRGAQAAKSVAEIADRVETVLVSLPSPEVVLAVATDASGGKTIKRFVDLSTTGATMAKSVAEALESKKIAHIDSPVSGGVGGAQKGTLAVMVSGPAEHVAAVKDTLAVFGKIFVIGDKPGMAQTMKLANNMCSAAAMAATSEAVVMGVKSGLDPHIMIDVINAGSGQSNASMAKFPRSILPRSFDFGFTTGLMAKDVRLFLAEAKALGVQTEVTGAAGRVWETAISEMGAASDFTNVIQPIEKKAGVIVAGKK
ncbi:MAG: NAD(P)-dependent oxidoreductase [Pseudolabrys sp.]|nr:NAD(P)-dependent oxidoreductase [Pseudolabrys sp.]